MAQEGWIGVDLDGTLAQYIGWKGPTHIGDPVPAMLERVKAWLADGQEVKIFTARVACFEPYRSDVIKAIHEWLDTHGLPRLDVTNRKDMLMLELWDDRAVQVEKNTGRVAVLTPPLPEVVCLHDWYKDVLTWEMKCGKCGATMKEKAA